VRARHAPSHRFREPDWRQGRHGPWPDRGHARQCGSNDFTGWGRTASDFATGLFVFETVKPGRTLFADGRRQAPHISISIFARGINIHLQTRLYFSDEAAANETDPVLHLSGQPELVATLIAERAMSNGPPLYRFPIHLQGDRETVFFDF
jgi:protocatechuate 3,4-dioxygenase alpha subunit